MNIEHVSGQDRGEIFLFALSTCGWCKKTKAYLRELGVEFRYVDVDLVPGNEIDAINRELDRWNAARTFPTVVIGKRESILGYHPESIRAALGL